MNIETIIRGAVLGLVTGDALSAPSSAHRIPLLAPKRAARMRSLAEYSDNQRQTTRPYPYTHAQPNWLLHPGPSDDVEWFTFSAENFLSKDDPALAWKNLAKKRETILARTGTKIALKNLADGLNPPQSGHDNPHYFDDIAMARSLAASLLCFKDQKKLSVFVQRDAEVTHSEDGVFCALALAHFAAALIREESLPNAIDAALTMLPKGSWSRRIIEAALLETKNETDLFTRVVTLERKAMENIYAFPVSAPETLALLLSHAIHANNAHELTLSALSHKRKLDSLPALAGAIAGIRFGDEWIPAQFKSGVELAGVCIPDFKGKKIDPLIESLIHGI